MSVRLQVIGGLDECIDSLTRRLEKARALRDEVAKLPEDDASFTVLNELKHSRFRSCRKLFSQITQGGDALEGLANVEDVLKKISTQKQSAETQYFNAGYL